MHGRSCAEVTLGFDCKHLQLAVVGRTENTLRAKACKSDMYGITELSGVLSISSRMIIQVTLVSDGHCTGFDCQR